MAHCNLQRNIKDRIRHEQFVELKLPIILIFAYPKSYLACDKSAFKRCFYKITHWLYKSGIDRIETARSSKLAIRQNLLTNHRGQPRYKNEFYPHEYESVEEMHFHINRFTGSLVLTQTKATNFSALQRNPLLTNKSLLGPVLLL